MGHSDLDPAVHERRPRNAGQNVGPKRPLKPRDIWAIRFYRDEHGPLRDRDLFDLAIDSKLRGCDLDDGAQEIRIALFRSKGAQGAECFGRSGDECHALVGIVCDGRPKREQGVGRGNAGLARRMEAIPNRPTVRHVDDLQ